MATKDTMLEMNNAPSTVALPHLLLTGIAVAVQKGNAKVDLGVERAEVKAKARAKKQPVQWFNQGALLVFQYQWHL